MRENGDVCPDGSVGTLKVYVNGKLNPDPERYVPAPHIYVPPGDCIIFEFGPGSALTTERICDSWAVEKGGYD